MNYNLGTTKDIKIHHETAILVNTNNFHKALMIMRLTSIFLNDPVKFKAKQMKVDDQTQTQTNTSKPTHPTQIQRKQPPKENVTH